MKLTKSKLKEIIKEELQKLNEFQAGDKVRKMIEGGVYDIEDGFKALIQGMIKAWESDMPSRSKIIKELKKLEKQFEKIEKIIHKEMY